MRLKRQISVYLVVMMLTYIFYDFIITPYIGNVMAVSYGWGSSGSVITEIQNRLKRWGYYTGSVDGRYGYGTYSAVKKFQTKNGLTADGVVGDATLRALGVTTGQKTAGVSSTNNQNLTLLARLINGEARGEPYQGQVAVGAVIMNRVKDPRFPNTVAAVIYQPGAFTAIVDGQINANLEQSSINAARDALNGWDPSGGAVFYYNPAKTTNKWIWSRPVVKIIGSHRFCR